jgi:hypothetical protein
LILKDLDISVINFPASVKFSGHKLHCFHIWLSLNDMKNKFINRFPLLFFLPIFLLANSLHAQRLDHPASLQGPPVGQRELGTYSVVVNIHGEDGFYLKKNMDYPETWTIVHGERVSGTPYLFPAWFDGIIRTPDGRAYNYKLRYDAFHQTLSFINGADTLEVNEAVREFVIAIPVNDTLVMSRFIHAGQLTKEKNPAYYEVLIDHAKGILLKSTVKKIASASGDALLPGKGSKYFNPVFTYYYYDKASKILSGIKPGGANLEKFLGRDINALHPANYDFSREEELIVFFKKYFNM